MLWPTLAFATAELVNISDTTLLQLNGGSCAIQQHKEDKSYQLDTYLASRKQDKQCCCWSCMLVRSAGVCRIWLSVKLGSSQITQGLLESSSFTNAAASGRQRQP